ncbi:hypothetical protein BJ944DRAFT_237805 [Cunninghamella echinulata]|nr:hypothetical protein BJ944DRAFT_237805 [Cunninghamella echinulata]
MAYNLRFWKPRRITIKNYPVAPITFRPEIIDFLETLRGVDNGDYTIRWLPTVSPLVYKAVKDVIKVVIANNDHESCVDDLATSLLMLFRYDREDNAITSKLRRPLTMSGQGLTATSNVCIQRLDNPSNVLLLQENKSFSVGLNAVLPEGQLIAEVISAYANNTIRHQNGVFPAIIMLGTQPTFYLIYMTPALVEAVRSGTRPEVITIVNRFRVPTETRVNSRALLREQSAEYIAVSYNAFRKFINFNN